MFTIHSGIRGHLGHGILAGLFLHQEIGDREREIVNTSVGVSVIAERIIESSFDTVINSTYSSGVPMLCPTLFRTLNTEMPKNWRTMDLWSLRNLIESFGSA
jgi:hypothetical protein